MTVRLGWALPALAMTVFAACVSAVDPDEGKPTFTSIDAGTEHDAGSHPTLDAAPLSDAAVPDATLTQDAHAEVPDAASPVDASMQDASPAADAAADAAADSGVLAPLPTLDRLPWPGEPAGLIPCTPGSIGFDPLTLAHAGDIAIGVSAKLQPRGVEERVVIEVLTPDDEVDTAYNGSLVWSLPNSVELVRASSVVDGAAEATLRFGAPGVTRIQVGLQNDPRTGYRDVMVYTPQLPIWELTVAPDDFDRIVDEPDSAELVEATLKIDGTSHPTLMRLHGGSSRYYAKKSFRFDLLDTSDATWGTHLIARAEYNDKSMLRNWLSMQMFRASTWVPTPRTQFVHFRINGRYYGVMNNVERIDGPFLKARGLSGAASLYEADPPDTLATAGNLSVLPDPAQYRMVYQRQRGMLDYQDLIKLIEQTLVVPDADFERVSRQEIAVDDYLVYFAMMATIQNHDNVRKNYYLYRDGQADPDSGWQVFPWDLDLTFGHLWSEENDVFEEEIASDSDIFVGVHVPELGGFYNQMADRMLRTASYRIRFRAMLDKLLASYVTRAKAKRLIDNVLCRAAPDLAADTRKRATNSEYLERVDEIYDYIDARAAYVQALGPIDF